MSKSISFNPIRRLVSKIIGYICTKRNSRLVVRWPTKKSARALGTRMTLGGFLYFICMISFFVAWFLFNFCGFFLSACLYLHGSFFIGVVSFYLRGFIFVCVFSFIFAWFHFYLRDLHGFIFICVVSFLFACFLFYLRGLRGFIFVCVFSFLFA